jgi:hypothetical protein
VITLRIAIVSFGSRGDVQPYLALGLGLKHAWPRHAFRRYVQARSSPPPLEPLIICDDAVRRKSTFVLSS